MGIVCSISSRRTHNKSICHKNHQELHIHYVKLFYQEIFIVNEALMGLNRFKVAHRELSLNQFKIEPVNPFRLSRSIVYARIQTRSNSDSKYYR